MENTNNGENGNPPTPGGGGCSTCPPPVPFYTIPNAPEFDDIDPDSPCGKLKAILNDLTIFTSNKSLRSKSGSNTHVEHGFTYKKTNGATIPLPELKSWTNGAKLDISSTSIFASSHTHAYGDDGELYQMLDVQDILGNLYISNHYLPIGTEQPFFPGFLVVGGYTYTAFPNDMDTFQNMYNDVDTKMIRALDLKLTALYDEIDKNTPRKNFSVSGEKLARVYLDFMNKDAPGRPNFNISLYRISDAAYDTTKVWEKVEIDPSTDGVKIIPCNLN